MRSRDDNLRLIATSMSRGGLAKNSTWPPTLAKIGKLNAFSRARRSWFGDCTVLRPGLQLADLHDLAPGNVKQETMRITAPIAVDRPLRPRRREESPQVELPLEILDDPRPDLPDESTTCGEVPKRGIALIDFYI